MSKKNMGSSIEEAQAQAVKEVVAWQLAEAMRKKKLSKARRTQVDRLLDPKNDVMLSSLQRAAVIVGRCLTIRLI